MNCTDIRAWLRRDLDGAVEPSGDVAAHLDRCAECRAEAKRLQEIAAAGRDALPRAEVPIDFTDRTMGALVDGPSDQALAEAGRPRFVRWVPVLVALVAVPLLVKLWPARSDEVRELAPFAEANVGGVAVTALSPARLSGGLLEGGNVVLRTAEPALIRTRTAEIRLRADTTCVAMFDEESENMKSTILTLTVLAGAATVANAEGEVEVKERAVVRVTKGNPPRLDPEALQRELDRIRLHMDVARERLNSLRAQLEIVKEAEAVRRPKLLRAYDPDKGMLEQEVWRKPDLLRQAGITELETAAIAKWLHAARDGNVKARRVVDRWLIELATLREEDRNASRNPPAKKLPRRTLPELMEEAKRGDAAARRELEERRREIDKVLRVNAMSAAEVTRRWRELVRAESFQVSNLQERAKEGRAPTTKDLTGLHDLRDHAWELRLKLLHSGERELVDRLEVLYVRAEQMAEAAARMRALTAELAALRAAKKIEELRQAEALLRQYQAELAALTARDRR